MTNSKSYLELWEKIDNREEELKKLVHFPAGVALVDLLQEIHNLVLSGLVNTPASEVARVAEFQGKYKVITALLNQILEEEDADEAS